MEASRNQNFIFSTVQSMFSCYFYVDQYLYGRLLFTHPNDTTKCHATCIVPIQFYT